MTGIEGTIAPQAAANVVLLNVDCDITVYVGAAVKMDIAGKAFNALADSFANSNVIGIVEAKPSTVKCHIRVLGVTSGHIFAALDPTKEYFLSATVAGGITSTPPTGSGEIVLNLGQPFSATQFLVNKKIRMERA